MPLRRSILRPRFNPTMIPGLYHWLDASDATTLTTNQYLEDGVDYVSEWRSKGGKLLTASQATNASQPQRIQNAQNGRAVIRIPYNTERHLKLGIQTDLYTPLTGVAVYKLGETTGTGARRLLWGGGVSSQIIIPRSTSATSYQRQLSFGTALNAGANTGQHTDWMVAHHVANGVDSAVARDLGADVTGTSGASTLFASSGPDIDGNGGALIGTTTAGTNFNGDIGEVLLYDRALTRSERERIVRYLAAKWGITV